MGEFAITYRTGQSAVTGRMRLDAGGVGLLFGRRSSDHFSWDQVQRISLNDPDTPLVGGETGAWGASQPHGLSPFAVVSVSLVDGRHFRFDTEWPIEIWRSSVMYILEEVAAANGKIFADVQLVDTEPAAPVDLSVSRGQIGAVPFLFDAPSAPKSGVNGGSVFMSIYMLGIAAWAAWSTTAGEPVLGPLACFVLVELALVWYRTASVRNWVAYDAAAAGRLARIARDLCGQTGHLLPKFTLRAGPSGMACVYRRKGQTKISVSLRLVDALDDGALKAIMAHEIAHLLQGDIRRVPRRALALLVGTAAGAVAAGIAAGWSHGEPIWIAGAFVGRYAALYLVSLSNRPIETRTDLHAIEMTGDPDALRRGLTVAYSMADQLHHDIYRTQPWRWLLWPMSWRLPTHPTLTNRLARLQTTPAN